LDQEYLEFSRDPRLLPATQANSDWDGLLSNTRKEQIHHIESLIQKDKFPKSEQSRVYRAGIPSINHVAYKEELLGFEMRQEDNPSENTRSYLGSYQRLIAALDRLSIILEKDGNLDVFLPYQNIELPYDLNTYEVEKTHGLNEDHAMEKNKEFLWKRIKSLLKTLSPFYRERLKKIEYHFSPNTSFWSFAEKYLRNNFSQRSTFHAFLHVFRDWDHYPDIQKLEKTTREEIINKINMATVVFLETWVDAYLHHLPDSFFVTTRMAFARWGHDSGLRSLFFDDHDVQNFDTFWSWDKTHYLPKNEEINDLARKGDLEGIHKLLLHGIAIDSRDRDGMTPLMWSSYYGHKNLVEFLLKNGADPTLKNHRNGNALIQAAYARKYEIVALLVKHEKICEFVNQYNDYKKSALQFLNSKDHFELYQEIEQWQKTCAKTTTACDQKHRHDQQWSSFGSHALFSKNFIQWIDHLKKVKTKKGQSISLYQF
jgi:hypothetical protein